MGLAFSDRRMGDADELRFCLELWDRAGSDIAHADLYTRNEACDGVCDPAFVWYVCFHSLGHGFPPVCEITFRAACTFDDRFRTHAPILLEFLSPFRDDLAWCLVGAREHIAAH